MEEGIKQSQSNTTGDSVRSRLPQSKRMSFWDNTFVLWGVVLVVSSLLVGGVIGTQLPFKQAMIVIAMAGVFNSLVSILIGIIGARTGYTSAMLFRYSYGKMGVLLPNFIIAITTVVWFAVILNLTRDAFVNIIGIGSQSPPLFWGITLLIAIIFVIPAYKTIKWIAYVDYIAAPAIIIILAITIWGSLNMSGGMKAIIQNAPAASGSILVVFTTAVGGWIHANTVISDFTRFYKNGKQATVGLFLTFGVLMVFQYVGATIGALSTGKWNIFLMMKQFGLLKVSFVAIFLGAWSTSIAAIYFGANMMSAPPIPEYKDEEKTRKLVLIISWIIALVFAWSGPDEIFNFFLEFLAWVIGPIAITVIIDYWLFPEKRKLYETKEGRPNMSFNPPAYLGWIAGFLIGYFSKEFLISIVNGMVVTGVLYYGWMRIAINMRTTPEEQIKSLFNRHILKRSDEKEREGRHENYF